MRPAPEDTNTIRAARHCLANSAKTASHDDMAKRIHQFMPPKPGQEQSKR
jgi:hypothetical protein